MEVKVSNKLIVKNPQPLIVEWCKKNLIIDNPDYYKKERLGKWTGDTPRSIWLYEVHGDELWLPFGCFADIWRLHPIQTDYTLKIVDLRRLKYKSDINLYPYQEKAVNEAIRRKNGILVMPCGSGKTQCGMEIIARLGGTALWLTHTQDLLNQSKKRAEDTLTAAGFGTITAGKVDIGSHITFATIQTLSKLDLSVYRDMWDVVIVDECQHCCGSPTRVTQFYKVVSSLSARYKIGLTATPKRADGLEQGMFALLGGIIHEVKREDIDTTCPVKVTFMPTDWTPDEDKILMPDGTIDYSKVIDNMIHDDSRFSAIFIELAVIPRGSAVMVLANRVELLKSLCDLYNAEGVGKGICLSGMGQSKKAKAERKQALEALNSGKLDCIFATYQLAKEGLDVPNLRYMIFATPEKDETTVIQAVGRVARKADGKTHGEVLDFVDDFGMYRGWATKRKSYYKKIGAECVNDFKGW